MRRRVVIVLSTLAASGGALVVERQQFSSIGAHLRRQVSRLHDSPGSDVDSSDVSDAAESEVEARASDQHRAPGMGDANVVTHQEGTAKRILPSAIKEVSNWVPHEPDVPDGIVAHQGTRAKAHANWVPRQLFVPDNTAAHQRKEVPDSTAAHQRAGSRVHANWVPRELVAPDSSAAHQDTGAKVHANWVPRELVVPDSGSARQVTGAKLDANEVPQKPFLADASSRDGVVVEKSISNQKGAVKRVFPDKKADETLPEQGYIHDHSRKDIAVRHENWKTATGDWGQEYEGQHYPEGYGPECDQNTNGPFHYTAEGYDPAEAEVEAKTDDEARMVRKSATSGHPGCPDGPPPAPKAKGYAPWVPYGPGHDLS